MVCVGVKTSLRALCKGLQDFACKEGLLLASNTDTESTVIGLTCGVAMNSDTQTFLSRRELARRWRRTESAISLASAVGAGPRYSKIDGQIMYSEDEVARFERACLFFDPAEVALQDLPESVRTLP